MIEITPSLKETFSYIRDTVPEDVFRKLCVKVGSSYPEQGVSTEEVARLSSNLGSDDEELCQRAVDTIYYLYSKVSYSTTKPSAVKSFLAPHIGEVHAASLSECWGEHALDIVSRLKNSSAIKKDVTKLVWDSSVSVSRDDCAKLRDPEAVLQVEVDGEMRNILFDFESLTKFYSELERIQSAIDDLA